MVQAVRLPPHLSPSLPRDVPYSKQPLSPKPTSPKPSKRATLSAKAVSPSIISTASASSPPPVAFTKSLSTACIQPLNLPPSYHHFADQRIWLSIPHFSDVASNIAFLIAGLWGLAFLSRKSSLAQFIDARERWPYFLVFLGLVLTAFGSAYYHLAPDNERLVWDRLPMTVVFMPLVAALIAERVNVKLGVWLLPILTAVGIGRMGSNQTPS